MSEGVARVRRRLGSSGAVRGGSAPATKECAARDALIRAALQFVLVAGIVAQAAFLVRAIIASTAAAATPAPPDAAAEASASIETVAAAVFDAHLFGEAPVAVQAVPSASVASVELRGTIALAHPAAGYAILAVNGAARVYRAGEPAGDGVTLTAVYTDRVVVTQMGVAQTILLPRNALTGNYVPAALAAMDGDSSVEAVIAPSQEQLTAEAEIERIRAFNEAERAAAARLQARAR